MSTSDLLTVEYGDRADAVLLHVRGEIDMGTAPVLRGHLEDAVRRGTDAPVLLDLTGVGFLASAGLALLVEYHTRCRDEGRALRVLTDGGAVLRAIQISSLDHVLEVHPSVAEAMSADHAGG
ncbi:STAS domain-containing protein [Actinokineospora sp. NBRC 105648]|uniref:STAS domain-containing protein n=1 Tax=Actinokineospora sp. NBRC 105648 TaxID=3032206 RepID=UPI0024A297D4|nr:STAS domain-containing protein [Actinokineospora sp. NBRC 105648]GLZ43468.1 anti-sigma factor antagonist [Actinokineospora sp. NBRC 105648]